MVLEKTLEIPLDCKGHLMQITDSFGKTLLLGKIEEKRRREPQRVYG